MAATKYSTEDLKLETENIEYAGDLKKVASGQAGATETVIVTEEDVSTPRLYTFWPRGSPISCRTDASERPSTGTFSPSSSGSTGCKSWTSRFLATPRFSGCRLIR